MLNKPEILAARADQVIELVGFRSRSTLYSKVGAGLFPPPRRIGGMPRWDVAELKAWLAAGSPSMDIWREKRKLHGFEG